MCPVYGQCHEKVRFNPTSWTSSAGVVKQAYKDEEEASIQGQGERKKKKGELYTLYVAETHSHEMKVRAERTQLENSNPSFNPLPSQRPYHKKPKAKINQKNPP